MFERKRNKKNFFEKEKKRNKKKPIQIYDVLVNSEKEN